MAQSGGHTGADVAEKVMGLGGRVWVAVGPGGLHCRERTSIPAAALLCLLWWGRKVTFISFTSPFLLAGC